MVFKKFTLGRYCHIILWNIKVCAAVKSMVLKKFALGGTAICGISAVKGVVLKQFTHG